jgi:hypothetical protein
MKSLPVLAAAAATLFAISGAAARVPAPGPGTPVPRSCPLLVVFGSYGAGIDRPTLERVEEYLAGERTVTNVGRYPWGREGEVTLCVRARGSADLVRIGNRIRAAIPARPRGPIWVENRARRW